MLEFSSPSVWVGADGIRQVLHGPIPRVPLGAVCTAARPEGRQDQGVGVELESVPLVVVGEMGVP